MSFDISWDNPAHTVILIVFPPIYWTWKDHIDALEKVGLMLDESQHSVDVISDLSNITTWIPPYPIAHFRRIRKFLHHPNMGTIALVGGGMMVRVFSDIFRNFSPDTAKRYVFIETCEKAREHLNKVQNGI